MSLAPVSIFSYKRPKHLDIMLSSLVKNKGIKDSTVFVFIDGPKNDDEKHFQVDIEKVVYRYKDYFKSLEIVKRPTNYGLSRNIPEGITEVLSFYDKTIVLEEDLYLSPYFLKFMNDALNFYEDEEKVMHISGYILPMKKKGLPDTFFIRPASCWGWATWKRAWFFERNLEKLLGVFDKKMIDEFNIGGCTHYFEQILANKEGRASTWAVFWYASVFLRGGYSLHPKYSYVRNIGFEDGLGESSSITSIFDVNIYDKPLNFSKHIEISSLASRYLSEYCQIGPYPYPKNLIWFLYLDSNTHAYWKEIFNKSLIKKPHKKATLKQTERFYHFNELLKALHCYLNTSKDKDITPKKAQDVGCLRKNIATYDDKLQNRNWTALGGWLGNWEDTYAVGITGDYEDIKPIIELYKSKAKKIYFPYPEEYKDDTEGQGLLLILL